jgi:hypothetical protein
LFIFFGLDRFVEGVISVVGCRYHVCVGKSVDVLGQRAQAC